MSSAEAKRSSGRFASARWTTSAKRRDTAGATEAREGGGCERWAETTAIGFGATNGGRPATSS
jgi:hypothetical protein